MSRASTGSSAMASERVFDDENCSVGMLTPPCEHASISSALHIPQCSSQALLLTLGVLTAARTTPQRERNAGCYKLLHFKETCIVTALRCSQCIAGLSNGRQRVT